MNCECLGRRRCSCAPGGDLLPIANSMAMAAKVPARPWPLMKMVLYFCGSRPTRPNRLPCRTAPNAGGTREEVSLHLTAGDWKTAAAVWPGLGSARLGSAHSQLMNQMVAMVTEKNRSCSMRTLTSTAVKMKSSRMKTRLPAMRTASDTLQAHTLTSVTCVGCWCWWGWRLG